MSEITLPAWAKLVPAPNDKVTIIVEVDSDKAYKALLLELGMLGDDGADLGIDQYWLEIAFQFAKMDVQASLEGTDFDPTIAGKCAQINFTRAPQWAQANFKVGRGSLLATKGQEARALYKRLRGRVPFSA